MLHTLLIAAVFGTSAAPLPATASEEPAAAAPAPQSSPAAEFAAAPRDTLPSTLHGRIVSEVSGAPIPFALIQIAGVTVRRTALADPEGRYSFAALPPGDYVVRGRALDHRSLEVSVRVPGGSELSLDLELTLQPIDLPGITVVSEAAAGDAGNPQLPLRGSPADPELRVLEATPGAAELGLADAWLESGPDPLDPSSVLYVRGAASDLKLVLLDGAPVYAPFHLGGLLDAFQPGVLGNARLYVGGAPARYDGGLSHILELQTRPGRRHGTVWNGAVDILGARSRVEGSVGGASFLVGGRTLHNAGGDALAGTALPYGYREALARVDLQIDRSHVLSATGFHNRESVDLNARGPLDGPAHWGNTAASLRYAGSVGATRADVTAAIGEFSARLPLGDTLPRFAEGQSHRIRLTADFEGAGESLRFGYGAAYDRQELYYHAEVGSPASAIRTEFRHGTAHALGLYGDVGWHPADDLEIRGGLRTNVFLPADQVRIAPRLSAAWKLSEHSRLSLAGGRYYQLLRSSESLLSSDLGETWTGPLDVQPDSGASRAVVRPLFAVGGASHVVLGLDHTARDDLRLGLEAFYKSFDDVAPVRGLRASGVDLWIDWRKEDWAAWAGYSLAWVWTADGRTAVTERFSSRQLVSGGVRVPLPTGVRLDLELASSSGIPFTPVPTGRPVTERSFNGTSQQALVMAPATEAGVAGAPEGSYLRLDGRLSRTWAARVFNVPFRMTPYVGLLNALDRRDALFYQFDARRDLRPRSLEAVPLLPIAGIEWEL